MNKQVKITIEEIKGEWVARHGKTYYTGVPKSAMSRKKYIQKCKEDHPDWLITNDVLEVPVEKFEPAVHPHKEELDKVFPTEPIEVVEVVNVNTGQIMDLIKDPNMNRPETVELSLIEEAQALEFNEPKVLQPQPKNINPLDNVNKQVNMNTNKEASADAPQQAQTVEQSPELKKRTFGGKLLSVTVGYPVYGIGTATHLALETTGDFFHALARGERNIEAYISDKVSKPVILVDTVTSAQANPNLSKEQVEQGLQNGSIVRYRLSREDIKLGIEARTEAIQGYAKIPGAAIKRALTKKSGDESMPQVAIV